MSTRRPAAAGTRATGSTRVSMAPGRTTSSRTSSRGGARRTSISEDANITPEILAIARQLAAGGPGLAGLAAGVRARAVEMPQFEFEKRIRIGADKGKKEVVLKDAAIENAEGDLMIFNPATGRYVEASQAKGRELRKGVNSMVYKQAAQALGHVLKDVRSRSEPGTSSRVPAASAGIYIVNPKEGRAAEIEFASKDFVSLLSDAAYRDTIVSNLRDVDAGLADIVQAVIDSGNFGRWVQIEEDGRHRWIKLGKEAFLNIAVTDPETAMDLVSSEALTDAQRGARTKSGDAAARSRERSSSRKAITNVGIKNPETKRRMLFGGTTYLQLVAEQPSLAAGFEREFRTNAAKEGMSRSDIDAAVRDVNAAVAANTPGGAPVRRVARPTAPRARSRTPSPMSDRSPTSSRSRASSTRASPASPVAEEEPAASPPATTARTLTVRRRPQTTT
jgi:hypothetical protein